MARHSRPLPVCPLLAPEGSGGESRHWGFPRPGGGGSGAVALGITLALCACQTPDSAPPMTKSVTAEIPVVPVPSANGPKLGAVADVTPILERPAREATQLGFLHAGAKVARAEQPYSTEGCAGGWYPVRPQGFVCVGDAATTDLSHPTLVAMAVQPKLDQPLPYAYARTREDTPLYARDPKRNDGVIEVRTLPRRSGMAVVGSWQALLPDGKPERFGLLPNGMFVKASALQAAGASTFHGVALDGKTEQNRLPIGFVVKRGVHPWRNLSEDDWKKSDEVLSYHEIVPLSGRFRTSGGTKYWAISDGKGADNKGADGKWVRHRDVTVVADRNQYPDFAQGDQKWVDISIVTGSAVFYEGQRPVYVTVVSVGHDRDGDPKTTQSTAQGDFDIVGKQITLTQFDSKKVADGVELFDLPWGLELSSGQAILGAYWHDRFGIEHGPGHLQFSPADAAWLWQWATPNLPEGWHGLQKAPAGEKRTRVRIRK